MAETNNNGSKRARFDALTLLALIVVLAINLYIFYLSLEQHLKPICYLETVINLLTVACIVSYIFVNKQQHTRNSSLEKQLKNVRESSDDLKEKLTYEMQVLSLHNEKMTLLIELSEIVQACYSIKEATKAIAIKCQKILHFAEGTLYIMDPTNNMLDVAVSWGEPVNHVKVITPTQCWALRKGGSYRVKNPHTDLVCEHIIEDTAVPYLCIPLMAQNSIFGLLHLDFLPEAMSLNNENQLLILAVTDTLSLALANINLRETLHNQSLHDALTGLYNRRYLNEFLQKELSLAARNKEHLAVIMLDIDFFKEFNDTYGHEVGDLLLQELGKFFHDEIRLSDIISRYGGEEFLCVLHDCNLENAKKRAEELRIGIAKITISYKNKKIQNITASLGIAVYPEDGDSMHDLIEAADKALYSAKNSARNKVIAYAEMNHPEHNSFDRGNIQ